MSETFAEHENGDVLLAALRVAETVKNAEGYDELVSVIAQRLAERGEFDRAVEIADTINDPYTRDKTLADIAVKCAAAGHEDEAFQLIDSLEDFSFQTIAASTIAVTHAAAGEFERAVEIADGMQDNSSTLAEIANQCAIQGETVRALEIAESLDFPLYTALALTRIAGRHLQTGRVDEAKELLSQALDETSEIDDDDRPSTLAEIALKLAEAGQAEQAAEILSRATNEAEAVDYRDPLLAQIAASYARLKQYDRAVEVVEKINEAYVTASALNSLAVIEYAEEGRAADALQLLSDAFDLLSESEPENQNEDAQRNNMLAHTAVHYAEFGQLAQALKVAQSIGSPHDRYQTLTAIALRLAHAGDADSALNTARAIDEDVYRVNAIYSISRAMISADAQEQGLEILSEALRLTDKLERPISRVHALTEAAIAYAEAQQKERSAPLLRRALTESKLITSEYEKASALLAIAEAYEKTGDEPDEEATELLWEISAI